MGSAVGKDELSRLIEIYSAAGIGGFEIMPIYGVRGKENMAIPFLSPSWMEMLSHTIGEGKRFGIGVDMDTGTGWPFGGPHITPALGAKKLVLKSFAVRGGETATGTFELGGLQAAMAVSGDGKKIDLMKYVNEQGRLEWPAPPGDWKVYTAVQQNTMQRVKRAAPGGEGLVVDHFSNAAVGVYLERFTEAFRKAGSPRVRSFLTDSYEVFGANWTDDFLSEFRKQRGYDLRAHIDALAGDGDPDTVSRVLHDYRETLSDLLLERFAVRWSQWTHKLGSVSRYQAHGSPGNLLDLYSAADIPETETFGSSGFDIPGLRTAVDISAHAGKPDPLLFKFAASAAHLNGRRFASSETCTWLNEHYSATLSQMKPEIDQLFVAGINHVLFHGATYSPKSAKWPGWQFYASVEYNPTNTIWHDFPALTSYIARVQAFLQSGRPSNDLLIYWPVHDLYSDPSGKGSLERQLSFHNAPVWLRGSNFGKTASALWERGYSFDYVSDLSLSKIKASKGSMRSGNASWRALIVPKCRFIPVDTMNNILLLAKKGVPVVFIDSIPTDAPGLYQVAARREKLKTLLKPLRFSQVKNRNIKEAMLGKGKVLLGDDVELLLGRLGIARESVVDHGVRYIRRAMDDGYIYFISNLGPKRLDGSVALGAPARGAVIYDPLSGRSGVAVMQQNKDGAAGVYLQLDPGESLVLRTFSGKNATGPAWHYTRTGDRPFEIKGEWNLRFLDGGPKLPDERRIPELVSWTELGEQATKYFSGTAVYSIDFTAPEAAADDWLLELGDVAESARVRINGHDIGTAFCTPFRLSTKGALSKGVNTLEIEVTNLAINRIISMDKKGTLWKIFSDINIVDINYKPFDASNFKPVPSGLIGPVRLLPVTYMNPRDNR